MGLRPGWVRTINALLAGVFVFSLLAPLHYDASATQIGVHEVATGDTDNFLTIPNRPLMTATFDGTDDTLLNSYSDVAETGGALQLDQKDGSFTNTQFGGTGDSVSTGANVAFPSVESGEGKISSTWDHTLAVGSDGYVYAWGDNSQGQLGQGDTVSHSTPLKVKTGQQGDSSTFLVNIKWVAAGRYHSLAVDNTGNIWAWGSGANGRLGNGATSQQTAPVRVLKGEQSYASGLYFEGALQVAAHESHSIVLDGSGNVFTFGQGANNVLGNNLVSDQASPVRVLKGQQTTSSGLYLEHVKSIGAGAWYSFGVDESSEVYWWGGGSGGMATPQYVPKGAKTSSHGTHLDGVVKVSGGEHTKVANPATEFVVNPGDETYTSAATLPDFWFSLGGTAVAFAKETTIKHGGSNAVKVTAGSGTTNQGLYQLIDGIVGGRSYTATVWQRTNGGASERAQMTIYDETAASVVGSAQGTTATTTYAQLTYSWTATAGHAYSMKLHQVEASATGRIAFFDDASVQEQDATADHAVALASDGTVWTWGYGANGRLGNGATTDHTTDPVQVIAGQQNNVGKYQDASGNNHFLIPNGGIAASGASGTRWGDGFTFANPRTFLEARDEGLGASGDFSAEISYKRTSTVPSSQVLLSHGQYEDYCCAASFPYFDYEALVDSSNNLILRHIGNSDISPASMASASQMTGEFQPFSSGTFAGENPSASTRTGLNEKYGVGYDVQGHTSEVSNSDFETYTTTPGAPDSWITAGGAGVTFAKETTITHGGSNAVKVTVDGQIVANRGFDTYTTTPGAPDSWTSQGGTGLTFDKETTITHTGPNALKITAGGTTNQALKQVLATPVSLNQHTFSAWARTGGAGTARLEIHRVDTDALVASINGVAGTTTYTQITSTWVPVAGVSYYVLLTFNTAASGQITYFDDISISETTLTGQGLKQQITGWVNSRTIVASVWARTGGQGGATLEIVNQIGTVLQSTSTSIGTTTYTQLTTGSITPSTGNTYYVVLRMTSSANGYVGYFDDVLVSENSDQYILPVGGNSISAFNICRADTGCVNAGTANLGDVSLFMAFEIDTVKPTALEALAGAAGSFATFNTLHSLEVLVDGKIRYTHQNGNQVTTTLDSSLTIGTGAHTLWMKRDATAKTVKVVIDGTTFINAGYTTNPTSGTNDLWKLGSSEKYTDKAHFLDGGLFEFRFWPNQVSDATLTAIADPTSNTYRFLPEGHEWFVDWFGTPAGWQTCTFANMAPINVQRNLAVRRIDATKTYEANVGSGWQTCTYNYGPVEVPAGAVLRVGAEMHSPGGDVGYDTRFTTNPVAEEFRGSMYEVHLWSELMSRVALESLTDAGGSSNTLGGNEMVAWFMEDATSHTYLTSIQDVAASGGGGIAIDDKNMIWTWGKGRRGELGDFTVGDSTSPVWARGESRAGKKSEYAANGNSVAGMAMFGSAYQGVSYRWNGVDYIFETATGLAHKRVNGEWNYAAEAAAIDMSCSWQTPGLGGIGCSIIGMWTDQNGALFAAQAAVAYPDCSSTTTLTNAWRGYKFNTGTGVWDVDATAVSGLPVAGSTQASVQPLGGIVYIGATTKWIISTITYSTYCLQSSVSYAIAGRTWSGSTWSVDSTIIAVDTGATALPAGSAFTWYRNGNGKEVLYAGGYWNWNTATSKWSDVTPEGPTVLGGYPVGTYRVGSTLWIILSNSNAPAAWQVDTQDFFLAKIIGTAAVIDPQYSRGWGRRDQWEPIFGAKAVAGGQESKSVVGLDGVPWSWGANDVGTNQIGRTDTPYYTVAPTDSATPIMASGGHDILLTADTTDVVAGSYTSRVIQDVYEVTAVSDTIVTSGSATATRQWRSGWTLTPSEFTWTDWTTGTPEKRRYYQYRYLFDRDAGDTAATATVDNVAVTATVYPTTGTGQIEWQVPNSLSATKVTIEVSEIAAAEGTSTYLMKGSTGSFTTVTPGEEFTLDSASTVVWVEVDLTAEWDTPTVQDLTINWVSSGEVTFTGTTTRTSGSASEVNLATVTPTAYIGAAALAVPVSTAVTAVTTVTDGEEVADASSYATPCKLVGSTKPTIVTSPLGSTWSSAASFNGANSGLQSSGLNCGSPGTTAPSAYSLMVRGFKTASTSTEQTIAGQYDGTVAGSKVRIYVTSGGKVAVTHAGSSSFTTVTGTTSLSTSSTYAVEASWDGTTLRLFLNGGSEGSASVSTTQSPATTPMLIGKDFAQSGSPHTFNGQLDEVWWSKTARHTSTFTPAAAPYSSDSNTVGLWHLDSKSTKTLTSVNALNLVTSLTYFYDAASRYVYSGTSAYNGEAITFTVTGIYGASFSVIVPRFLKAGDYWIASGTIKDVSGNPVNNVQVAANFYQLGILKFGPVTRFVVQGNVELSVSTNYLAPGAYNVTLSYADPSGVTFTQNYDLTISSGSQTSQGSNSYADASVYFHFFTASNGIGLDDNTLKVLASDQGAPTSNNRIVGGRKDTTVGLTVNYRVEDFWGNKVYPLGSPTYQGISVNTQRVFVDVGLNLASFKVKNTNSSVVHFHILQNSIDISEYILPQEIVNFHLLPGTYDLELDYYNSITGAFQETVTDSVVVSSDIFYWIKGHDLADIVIEINSVGDSIANQLINVGVNINNVESNIGTQINGLSTTITNLGDIGTQVNNVVTNINNQLAYRDGYNPLPSQVSHYAFNEYGGTGSDVLTNGGFETYTTSPGAPDGWSLNGLSSSNVAVETTNRHMGTNAVKITIPTTDGGNAGISQSIALTSGKAYYFECWAKTDGQSGNRALMFLQSGASTVATIAGITSVQGFDRLSFTYYAPTSGSYNLYVTHYSNTATHVLYVDDCSVKQIEAVDSGSLANNGKPAGVTLGALGRIGSAYGFDGSSDYVRIPDNDAWSMPGQGSWGTELWFKRSNSAAGVLLGKSDSNGAEWALAVTNTGAPKFTVYTSAGSTHASLTCSTPNTDTTDWHHVVINTYTQSSKVTKIECYQDDVLSGTTSPSPSNSFDNTDSAVYVGQRGDSGGEGFFAGFIDEVKLHNKALTAEEVGYASRATAPFYQFNNLEATINNQGATITAQYNNIQVSISNLQSTVESQFNSIIADIDNSHSDIGAQVNSVSVQITNLDASITDQLNTISTTIDNNDASIDTQLNSLYSTVSNNHAAVTSQINDVLTAIDNTDSDLSIQINDVSTTVTNTGTTIGNQVNGISTQITNLDSGITTQFNTLSFDLENVHTDINTQLNDISVTIDNNDASIDSQLNTISTAINNNDASIDTQLNTIYSTITNNEATIESQVNDVLTAIDNTGADLSLQINDVQTTITNTGTTIGNQVNAVSTQITNLDSSVATQFNTLTFDVNNQFAYRDQYQSLPGLVHHWGFNEGTGTSTQDYVGGAASVATLQNGVAWADGHYGKAGAFDAVNDYASFPQTSGTQATGSVEAWFKRDSSSATTKTLVDLGGSGNNGLILRGFGATSGQVSCQYGRGSTTQTLAGGSMSDTNTYHHVVCAWDDAGVKLYLDNVLVDSSVLAPSITFLSTGYMGARAGSAEFFPGKIDEVRLYNRALAASEVDYLFKADSPFYQFNTLNFNVNNNAANIQTQLNTISTTINDNEASIDTQLNTIYSTITDNQAVIQDQMNSISTQIDDTQADLDFQINSVSTQVTNAQTSIESQVNAVSTEVTNTDSHITTQINTVRDDISNLGGSLGTQINSVSVQISNLDSSIQDQVNDILAEIQNTNTDIGTQLNDIQASVDNTQATVTTQFNALTVQVSNVQSYIGNQITIVRTDISDQGTVINNRFDNMDAALTADITSVLDNMDARSDELFDQTVSIISDLAQTQSDLSSDLLAKTTSILTKVDTRSDAIVAKTVEILDALPIIVDDVTAQVNLKTTEILDQVNSQTDAIIGKTDDIITKVDNLNGDLADVHTSVLDAVDTIVRVGNDIQLNVTSTLRDMNGTIYQINNRLTNVTETILAGLDDLDFAIGNIGNLSVGEVLNKVNQVLATFNAPHTVYVPAFNFAGVEGDVLPPVSFVKVNQDLVAKDKVLVSWGAHDNTVVLKTTIQYRKYQTGDWLVLGEYTGSGGLVPVESLAVGEKYEFRSQSVDAAGNAEVFGSQVSQANYKVIKVGEGNVVPGLEAPKSAGGALAPGPAGVWVLLIMFACAGVARNKRRGDT